MGISKKYKLDRSHDKINLKKGDTVQIIKGKDSYEEKSGRILEVSVNKHRVVVEGMNLISKHQRPTQKLQKGGIIRKEGTISIANVRLVCPHCSQLPRIAKKQLENGKYVRSCNKCGEIIDKV